MDLEFVQTLHHMLPLAGMAAEEHMKFYLKIGNRAKLIWPKVEQPRKVRKERLLVSFQGTPYEILRKGKNQEDLELHGLNMAAPYARFIFAREGLVGRSIFNFLSL